MQIFENYIYTKQLNFDLEELKLSVYRINDIVENTIKETFTINPTIEAPDTTKYYEHYNLLMYPFSGFYDLYFEIQRTYRSITQSTIPCYIQCWVNIFKKDDFIPWHNHWIPEIKAWHGFLCVNGENSITSYRLPNNKIVDIVNKNNQLVLSKSDGDYHRTYEWDKDEDRITIAFDIVPAEKIHFGLNHWIPI